MQISKVFLEACEFNYEQHKKRADNFVHHLAKKKYKFEKKGIFKNKYYEVNCFWIIEQMYGDMYAVPERLLKHDMIDAEAYQLLKFWDMKEELEDFLDEIKQRPSYDGFISVSEQEDIFLRCILSFYEDPSLTKEDILNAQQL